LILFIFTQGKKILNPNILIIEYIAFPSPEWKDRVLVIPWGLSNTLTIGSNYELL
jgi:hypothetical protein